MSPLGRRRSTPTEGPCFHADDCAKPVLHVQGTCKPPRPENHEVPGSSATRGSRGGDDGNRTHDPCLQSKRNDGRCAEKSRPMPFSQLSDSRWKRSMTRGIVDGGCCVTRSLPTSTSRTTCVDSATGTARERLPTHFQLVTLHGDVRWGAAVRAVAGTSGARPRA